MFFIVNHENSIIAADADFLEEIDAKSVHDAALLMQKGVITLDTQAYALLYGQKKSAFSMTVLSTFFGEAYLYQNATQERTTDQSSHLAPKVTAPSSIATEEILEDTEHFEIAEQTEDSLGTQDDLPDLSVHTPKETAKEAPLSQEDNIGVQTELSDASLQALLDEAPLSQSSEDIASIKKLTEKSPVDVLSAQDSETSIDLLDIDAIGTDPTENPDKLAEDEEILDLADLKDILPTEETLEADEALLDSDIFGLADDPEPEISKKDTLIDKGTALGLAGAGMLAGKMQLGSKEDASDTESLDLAEETKSEGAHLDLSSSSQEADTLTLKTMDSESAKTDAIELSTDTKSEDMRHLDDASSASEIAALIGVSEEEYLLFLDDFRNEVYAQESKLRSPDIRESKEAITSLTEASLLLHLPQVTENFNALAHATSEEKGQLIDTLLGLISKASGQPEEGHHTSNSTPEIETFSPIKSRQDTDLDIVLKDEIKTEFDIPTDIVIDKVEETPEAKTPSTPSPAPLSLDTVKSIPFDFSINAAADELTLPVSLVEEFVIDFIDQAKENLPVLQRAHEEEDLETIQSTAHMLKGASSNLRILPMADTLYTLQFNDNLAQVPEILTRFAGQLKALSAQMGHA